MSVCRDVEVGETPIGRETNNFVHLITALASCIGVMFVVYGIIIGLTPLEIILNLIAIMVCTVPEGLLATITVTFLLDHLISVCTGLFYG